VPDGLNVSSDVAVAMLDDGGLQIANTTSAMPVFSVTKMFIATAALRLVDSGRLALDEEVAYRVPESPGPITVHELLGHTSGLPNFTTATSYMEASAADPARPWPLERAISVALQGVPGARGRFRYSNLGYCLLGLLVQNIVSMPFRQALATLVFEPAGMTSTFVPAPEMAMTPAGYDTRWAGLAGAAWSTPRDLVIFLTALQSGSLLTSQSLAAMTSPIPVAASRPFIAGRPWRTPSYGLGVMIDTAHCAFGHGGRAAGYASAAFIAPDRGRSAAVIVRPPAQFDATTLALRLLGIDVQTP
jgi:D-alanyl-D-alanine carboxypeptidase